MPIGWAWRKVSDGRRDSRSTEARGPVSFVRVVYAKVENANPTLPSAVNTRPRSVALLLFDGVEVLDFAAPFEVFSVAGRRTGLNPFEVVTVSAENRVVQARNGLRVTARYKLNECPPADVVVIPGGFGTRTQMRRAETLEWARRVAMTAEVVFSICTGSLILAAAGLLRGKQATTHRDALKLLRDLDPTCNVVTERIVDSGSVVCAAGVSAGLDASLHLVARLTGADVARECAEYIEYTWEPAVTEEAR